ncbi:MAG: YdeI/OmpD-associated family protein, partial [Gemmatimonadales bacterium]
MKELPVRRFATKAAWETWLEQHHESSPGLWLEFAKKGGGVVSLSQAEALGVALCYGWIDGQAAPVDSARFRQRFTPRRPKSKWSQINCAAVERLQAEGRLAPAGLRQMDAAKQDGRWDAAYASPRNMTVP